MENDIIARIETLVEEHASLDDLLSPILKRVMHAKDGVPYHGWHLDNFDTCLIENVSMVRLEARDERDGERRSFYVPANVINEDTIDAHCKRLVHLREVNAKEKAKADRQHEIARLEERLHKLKDEESA